ncbi:NADH-ubiquinone oxidoreductase subunit, mitochondrial [Grifola frondosa]|uniref:NADH-ubiquinone oxidoreductase subunit, mitochondrial n=1 Tax=Grifola frondosa TaxID=5627 RepID=A0A1C7M8K5_GRIFR|nr:NADH-ubiquinone oxidoreductase subunit, mitochondrial [Grifola frondosa]
MPIDEARAAEYKARLQERNESIRESWVRTMECQIVKDNVQKCFRLEGVNHLEKCKALRDRYLEMLAENRLQGYKVIDI